MSRNFGSGVKSVYSCNAAFGSFVLNAEAGIVAPERPAPRFRQQRREYGRGRLRCSPQWLRFATSSISEGSTDGSTHARRSDGGKNAWVSVGKPMLYVVSRGAGVTETGNHISTYGGAIGSSAVRIVK